MAADALPSIGDVARVLLHETLGYSGLRGVFGQDLGRILDQIANMRCDLLKEVATIYGLDLTDARERRIAA